MKRIQKVSTGAKWEEIVGYSRAIRINNIIEVAGTTAIDENGNLVGKDDLYEQTLYIIQKAEKALIELGARLKDVIRTRIFTTDISRWEEIGKAHGKYFKEVKPVATMVEVSKLINPDILVEIEFSAIV
jgi:enamine deaminase RidA (YjgF/YER057c/UK114 family)